MESIRAFIAIELPREMIEAANRIQADMASHGIQARWVRPDKMHLTLKFFKDLLAKDLDQAFGCIADALQGDGPVPISGKGVSVFPGMRKPRVVWMGLDDVDGRLGRLHERLEASFDTLGYPKEARAFQGHLTLGRFKENPHARALSAVLEAYRGFKTEVFNMDEVIFFRSELTPSGPIYTKMQRVTMSSQ